VLFDVSADPPVVILIEETDGDTLGTRSNREFVFLGTPLDRCRSSGDTKNDKNGLPFSTLKSPNVSIPVVGAGNDPVRVGGPINSGHILVMFGQNMLFDPFGSFFFIDVNLVVIWA
jgi:hypothetical protein